MPKPAMANATALAAITAPIMNSDQTVTVGNTEPGKPLHLPTLETIPSSASATTTATRFETARLVAAQMASDFPNLPGKPVEIALNPEELGRVRMVLSTSDGGVAVSITTERPETLDLMRRHADQLSAELRRMGYESIGFDFNGSSAKGFGRQSHDNSSDGSAEPRIMETETVRPGRPAQTAVSGGLDLRV